MSKKLTKITVSLLAVAMAICMVIGLTTVKTYAQAPSVTTFVMVDGASVRTQEPMGIRFTATISSDDYDSVKDGEFGVMIAPADFLDNLEEGQTEDTYFRHGVMPAYVEETTEEKFFNYATVKPTVNEKNADEYLIVCSFVGIKEYNFSRPFAARAYCKVGNAYYYTNIVEHAVYSVAADAVANNLIEDADALDYFNSIIDKVHTKYNTLNIEYSDNVNENAVEAGENFTVKATVVAADGKSLPTAVVMSDANAFPVNEDGTLKANKFGEFSISAGVGDLTNETVFNVTARSDTYIQTIKFTAVDLVNGTGKFVADVVDQGKVVANPTVTFKDNHGWGTGTVASDGTYTGWAGNGTYDKAHAYYVDQYGATYKVENYVVVIEPISYGQHSAYAHDGVIAALNYNASNYGLASLVYKNVDFDNNENTQLIRFQMIPPEDAMLTTPYDENKSFDKPSSENGAIDAANATKGMAAIQVTIQDAEDLNNYVTVSLLANDYYYYDWRTHDGGLTSAYVGLNASCWGNYQRYAYSVPNSTDTSLQVDYRINIWTKPFASRKSTRVNFSFYGNYLAKENYTDYMFAVSVKDTAVYATIGGKTFKIWDLVSDSADYLTKYPTDTYINSNWTGFKSNKVNIYVRNECSKTAYTDGYRSYLMIDTIGGKTLTANDVANFQYMRSCYNGIASIGGEGHTGSPVYAPVV